MNDSDPGYLKFTGRYPGRVKFTVTTCSGGDSDCQAPSSESGRLNFKFSAVIESMRSCARAGPRLAGAPVVISAGSARAVPGLAGLARVAGRGRAATVTRSVSWSLGGRQQTALSGFEPRHPRRVSGIEHWSIASWHANPHAHTPAAAARGDAFCWRRHIPHGQGARRRAGRRRPPAGRSGAGARRGGGGGRAGPAGQQRRGRPGGLEHCIVLLVRGRSRQQLQEGRAGDEPCRDPANPGPKWRKPQGLITESESLPPPGLGPAVALNDYGCLPPTTVPHLAQARLAMVAAAAQVHSSSGSCSPEQNQQNFERGNCSGCMHTTSHIRRF
jgi:hypothetical protein